MAIVTTDNKHYKAIADKVRSLGVEGTMLPSEMAQKVQEVYEKGIAVGGGDSVMRHITTIQNLFQEAVFPENYDLVIEVDSLRETSSKINASNFAYLSKNLRSAKLIYNGKKDVPLNGANMFRFCSTLETVDLTEFNRKFADMSYFAISASNLTAIYGELDCSVCTSFNTWLSGCTALEEIRFKEEAINVSIDFFWCSNLSEDTVNSIVDGLITKTDGVQRTVTFHATVKAQEWFTGELKAKITQKGWTLA